MHKVKLIYSDPNNRVNKLISHNKEFKGKEWKVRFTIDCAPTEEEYRELVLEVPKPYFPYAVSIKNKGLILLRTTELL
ncbi:hypothetical protein [Oceanobacillus jeddahense]|uniref:Uncharacterized protein n=1 Tax=Oceanobacillus jeddahense TaxID=1462527 RepID=A0ABY5JRY4_9BACI|nr:hypothetical protein [Oceanobacillus jeddahense]UUI03063.1 hypothetical protein NP439_24045 [Oceanobacillus jeddahense]